MGDPHLLLEILLLLAIAALGVVLFERLGLPAIAGFLVVGAAVGPGGLELVADPERVRSLAELGVVFLLFEIGLELPIDRLRRLWRNALVGGGLQVAATVLCVTLVSTALGLPLGPALVMGGLVAMSSTALVMRLLAERGEIDAPQGQLALGILLFQDLCIVPFLLAVPVLAAADPEAARTAALAVGRSVVALGVFFAVARFVLPRILEPVARVRSRDLFSLVAFLTVLGSAVAAEQIGLTLAVGAFLGGLVVSASPYAHQLFAEVVPLRGVLLGLFFTAVGMLFDPRAALDEWAGVLVYVGGVVVLKTVLVALVVGLAMRFGMRLGIVTGMTLAQTGEFSFVLAAAAAAAGLLEPGLQQVFIAGSVGTLVATPFLVVQAPRLASWVMGGVERLGALDTGPRERLADHVVLVGFGLANQQLARVLRARQVPYLAVEANARAVHAARSAGEPVMYGDATRRPILERLGIERARLVVVAISDPTATRQVVIGIRTLAPEVAVLARTRYVAEVDRLSAAGASGVIAEEFESAIALLTGTLRSFGIPEGSVAQFAAQLREEGYEPLRVPTALALDPWLLELLEQVSTEWVEVPDAFGREVSLTELAVRPRTGVSVLGIDRGGVITPNPAGGTTIRPGDRLLVFGSAEGVARLERLLAGPEATPGG